MAKIKTKARALLENHDALVQRRYVGDTAASDELIDLATAIEKAGLTERQAQVIKLRYVDGWEVLDMIRLLEISQQAISLALKQAIAKIEAVFDGWQAVEDRSPAQKYFDTLIAIKTTKEAA